METGALQSHLNSGKCCVAFSEGVSRVISMSSFNSDRQRENYMHINTKIDLCINTSITNINTGTLVLINRYPEVHLS